MRLGGVTYAQGGAWGISRSTAQAIIDTACINRVGTLAISRSISRRPDVHMFEDANLGLCAHLVRAPLIHCGGFQMYFNSKKQSLHDDTPEARLARHPITLHPIKDGKRYWSWHKTMLERDAVYDPSLLEWQHVNSFQAQTVTLHQFRGWGECKERHKPCKPLASVSEEERRDNGYD